MSLFANARVWAARKIAGKGFPLGVTERVSWDDDTSLAGRMNQFLGGLGTLASVFPYEFYSLIDQLVLTQPYISEYCEQTVSLGNTGHSLEISAANEARAKEALQAANDFAARCHPWKGGGDGIISGGLFQASRMGGTCIEWAPDKKKAQVARGYFIPFKTLRFRRREDGELELCQMQNGMPVPLNPVQTSFHAIKSFDENPYPIPPAISSLRSLVKLAKADESIDKWLDKLALPGLILANVEPPPRRTDVTESEDDYQARALAWLGKVGTSIGANLKHGWAATFSNVKLDFKNTSAGAAGAKDMMQLILQQLFSGLHRDPVFFGHNFNSTETFAKVVMEVLIAGVLAAQLSVKRAYEEGLRLNFALTGFGDVGVSLKFEKNRSFDAFMGAEAEQMESSKHFGAWDRGLISDDEARKELGYGDQAATSDAYIASFSRPEGRYIYAPRPREIWQGAALEKARRGGGADNSGTPLFKKSRFPSPPAKTSSNGTGMDSRLRGNDTVQYIGSHTENTARDARNAARRYISEFQDQLSAAGNIGVQAVYEWARVRDIPQEDLFVQEALQRFTTGAETSLSAATLERIAKEHLTKIWSWARYEDDSLFGPDWDRQTGGVGTILGDVDHRAIGYMGRVDRFFTSTYVSGDVRTSQQISTFLREQYLEKGLSRDKKGLAAFREEFSDLSERIGENRARVIVDTGVSRAQNWGEVYALHDEQVTTYKIAGPWDTTTCDWCKAMRGKEYSVTSDKSRIDNIISSGDEDITKFDSFITSRFAGSGGLTLLQGLTGEEVQATGMANPPIHPLCRHRMIAVIETKAGNVYRVYERPPVLAGSWRMAA